MANNPQKTILGDGACSEAPLSGAREPIVSLIVLHVRWVDKRNQDVDVQEERRHGCSSRS